MTDFLLVQTSLKETVSIDKISSLSCQKVAYSITSLKIGGNAAKQSPFFSVIHPNTFVVIRHHTARYNFL